MNGSALLNPRPSGSAISAMAFVFAVLSLLAGCTFLPFAARPPVAEPGSLHREAMRPAFVSDLSLPQLRGAPEYGLTVGLEPDKRLLTGSAVITITNRTNTPWTSAALRTFPNLPHYAGSMRVLGIKVNGRSVPFATNATNTAVLVDLLTPLEPQRPVRLEVQYEVSYKQVGARRYLLFGEQDGVINLPLAYPVVAVPDANGGWRLDDGIPLGDTLTAETSFFHVWATVPENLRVISSAVVRDQQPDEEGDKRVYEFVSGPAREFTLLLGAGYQALETEVNGITVRSYFLPGDEAAGQAALRYAAAALQVYSRHFGPYPFAKLDVAAAMLLNRGMEYPTLSQLGVNLYREERDKLEFLVAHEVAHQWWYNLVGNDQVREPWLDEGLAEYSTYFYYEDIYGRERAEYWRLHRWVVPLEYIRNRGVDAPLGLPASAYSNQNYESVVYAKGALFFHELRARLGDERFHRALRMYVDRYKYRLATAEDLRTVFEEATGVDLGPLFETWVYGTSSQAP